MEVVASLSQGRTAAAQCGLFTHKSVPVIFESPCIHRGCYFYPVPVHVIASLNLPACPVTATFLKERYRITLYYRHNTTERYFNTLNTVTVSLLARSNCKSVGAGVTGKWSLM